MAASSVPLMSTKVGRMMVTPTMTTYRTTSETSMEILNATMVIRKNHSGIRKPRTSPYADMAVNRHGPTSSTGISNMAITRTRPPTGHAGIIPRQTVSSVHAFLTKRITVINDTTTEVTMPSGTTAVTTTSTRQIAATIVNMKMIGAIATSVASSHTTHMEGNVTVPTAAAPTVTKMAKTKQKLMLPLSRKQQT